MANLLEWIESIADGEEIEAVVIGEMGWPSGYGSEDVPLYSECPKGKVISFVEARKYLDYEFSSDFGAPGCQSVWAWTETKVIAIGQYDGSTWPYYIPRNPENKMPSMEGC